MNILSVMNDAWNVAPDVLTPTERLVLLRLAFHANAAGGSIYPSVATLMRHTGATRRSVQMALRRLEELGFIDTEREARAQEAPHRRLDLDAIRSAGLPGDRGANTAPLRDQRGAETAPLPDERGANSAERGAKNDAEGRTYCAQRNSEEAGRSIFANGVSVEEPMVLSSRGEPDEAALMRWQQEQERFAEECRQRGLE
jgi:hypothetical protein